MERSDGCISVFVREIVPSARSRTSSQPRARPVLVPCGVVNGEEDMKRLFREIRAAVEAGRLKEPFSPADVIQAGVQCAASTAHTFLPSTAWQSRRRHGTLHSGRARSVQIGVVTKCTAARAAAPASRSRHPAKRTPGCTPPLGCHTAPRTARSPPSAPRACPFPPRGCRPSPR